MFVHLHNFLKLVLNLIFSLFYKIQYKFTSVKWITTKLNINFLRTNQADLDDFGVLIIFPALSNLSPDPPFPFPSPFGVLLSVDLDDFDTSAFEDLSFFAPFTPFAVFTDLADLDPVDLTGFDLEDFGVLYPFADFNTADGN